VRVRSDEVIRQRYLRGDYAAKNPTWDREDAPWKAGQAVRLVAAHGLAPASIAEVGCGSGAVLAEFRRAYPQARLHGYDIAPGAARFWEAHAAANIEFRLGDFFELSRERYDLMLVMDVIEHVPDPFDFLTRLRAHAGRHLFHLPLDLSALTVLREAPLLDARDRVGHVHYYTKGLALALLAETGYRILDWRYTGAAFAAPRRNWKTRLASLPRRMAYALDKDFGVRLFGGETLMVLACPDAGSGAPV
jgi:SAM-dependent methyltransferase